MLMMMVTPPATKEADGEKPRQPIMLVGGGATALLPGMMA
jgi:hypothetical protein